MTTNGSEVAPLVGPRQLHIDSFLDHRRAKEPAPKSVTNKGSIAIAFARWSQRIPAAATRFIENRKLSFFRGRYRMVLR
jgi:hypothetical protein